MSRMVSLRALGALFVGLTCGAVLSQQPQKTERLKINNKTSEPISVSILANGGPSPDANWHGPYRAEPGATLSFPLGPNGFGYEPFDITIRRADGIAYVFSKVNLCDMMKKCKANNWTNWNMPTNAWRQSRDADGRLIDAQDPAANTSFPAVVDEADVEVLFEFARRTGITSTAAVRCLFCVIDDQQPNGNPIVGATIVFRGMDDEPLGVGNATTGPAGRVVAEIPDHVYEFRATVILKGKINQRTFICRTIPTEQTLIVEHRKELPSR